MATPVTIEYQSLAKGTWFSYAFSTTYLWAFRTTLVWLAVWLLAPQFGITWWMVLLAIFAIQHASPIDFSKVVSIVNRVHAERRPVIATRADAELLRKRAAL